MVVIEVGAGIRAEGLVLRGWEARDVPAMVALFDTPEMDRWTPLASPFDQEAALAYVARAQRCRHEGTQQLAITEDGFEPLGEVIAFPTGSDGLCEFAYAVGAAFRGRGLAVRAIRAMLPVVAAAGYGRAQLTIAVGNTPSQHVAMAAGFRFTGEPLKRIESKGSVSSMATWIRDTA